MQLWWCLGAFSLMLGMILKVYIICYCYFIEMPNNIFYLLSTNIQKYIRANIKQIHFVYELGGGGLSKSAKYRNFVNECIK